MQPAQGSNSRLSVINLYREQLKKFKKIGLGNETEYGVVITSKLIDTTKKRLAQLSATYEASLTPDAWRALHNMASYGV